MPLVIYSLGGIHTHAHTHIHTRMKVISRKQAYTWLKIRFSIRMLAHDLIIVCGASDEIFIQLLYRFLLSVNAKIEAIAEFPVLTSPTN